MNERELEDFQKSIGITTFSRICLSMHNTIRAVWHILVSPIADLFTYTPILPPGSESERL